MRRTALAFALLVPLAGCVEPSTPPDVGASSPAAHEESSAFGRVVSADRLGDGRARVVLDAVAVDCRREARAWNATFAAGDATLPTPGVEAGFTLYRGFGDWQLQAAFSGFGEYAASCAHRHEHAVQAVPVAAREEARGGSAVRLSADPVPLGSRVPVTIAFESDGPTEVRLSNLALVNDEAYQATRDSAASALSGCRVDADDGAFLVDGAATRTVHVACDAEAEPRPTYEACRGGWSPGPAGGEPSYAEPACGEVRASRNEAALVGRLEFEDELGNAHAREATLRQMLHVGPDATLVLRVPERVDSRDAFVVEAEYVGADGRPVEAASLTMRIDWPGLEEYGFGMFYDGGAGLWRFTWDDFHEHAPRLWREGLRTVAVEAGDYEGGHVPRGASAAVEFA